MPGIKPQGYSSGGSVELERTLDYDFHKSTDELQNERKDLILKVQEIDTVLSEKNITDSSGRRLGNKRYNERRHELIKEKLKFNKRISRINKTTKQRHAEDFKEVLIAKEERENSREKTREGILAKHKTKEGALSYIEDRLSEIIREVMELQRITRKLNNK